MDPLFPLPHPKGYVCLFTERALDIDGDLEKAEWANAPWTDDFVDIEGDRKPAPRFQTRAKMLWDEKFFYIGAELREPHIWGTLTEHDAVIFQDNDFEVFIDPDGDNHEYYELEINALNTTWDLRLPKPYRDGGPALNEWEIPGMKTAVMIDGTLNDPSDTDRRWTVEIALPWKVLGEYARCASPPSPGDQWRVNFSRVEWETSIVDGKYVKVEGKPEDNWVWTPQWAIDMHRPELWGYVQFVRSPEEFRPDATWSARERLVRAYYAQKLFHREHARWAVSFQELGLEIDGVALSGDAGGFVASCGSLSIDHESRMAAAGN